MLAIRSRAIFMVVDVNPKSIAVILVEGGGLGKGHTSMRGRVGVMVIDPERGKGSNPLGVDSNI